MKYTTLARQVPDERRKLALDLARQLDFLTAELAAYQAQEDKKAYATALRLFLPTQKQFLKLLPPMEGKTVDALADFIAEAPFLTPVSCPLTPDRGAAL